MKSIIIKESIDSLKKDGLKFSLDVLSKKLKISKKTVYKHFSNKEELAFEIYKQFYFDLIEEFENKTVGDDNLKNLMTSLYLYYESSKMSRKEIFNKFSLNEAIRNFALQNHLNVWVKLTAFLSDRLKTKELKTFKVIVDGTFEKLKEKNEEVIMLLLRIVYAS